MKLFSFLICLLFACPSFATIYLVALDPASHSVGMVAISSGPVVSWSPHAMNGVKGIGFTGWSGAVSNITPSMDKKVFEMMKSSMSPHDIAAYVDSQIHEKYSRYVFVSTQGTLGYVFPPKGCAQPECGVKVSSTNQFFIMGGGLEHDVVPNAVNIYEKIHQTTTLPFECKLLAGIQTIINVGGEIKEFAEVGMAIDNPAKPAQQWYSAVNVPEKTMVANMNGQLSIAGIKCPAMRQVESGIKKPKRDPRSIDL